MRVPRLGHGLLAALVIATALGAYGQLLTPGRVLYSQHSDLMAQHLATKTILHESIRSGHGIPEWRDDQFAGNTAAGNPQAMGLYPFHSLFLVLDPVHAVGLTFFLNVLASAASFFLLGCALGLGREARWFMAAAGLVWFKLMAAIYAGWLSNTMVIALLPAFFAAVVHMSRSPSIGAAVALAISAALCATGGHFQYFYYAVLFAAGFFVWNLIRPLRSGDRAGLASMVRFLAVALVLGLGLSAYVLLPLALDAPLLSRTTPSYEFFLADHAFTPRSLLSFLTPAALRNAVGARGVEFWEDVGYFGVVPLLLAAFAIIRGRRNPQVVAFALALAMTILLTVDSPLLRFCFDYVPGYALFRSPNRMLFLTSVFGIGLAGIGLQALLEIVESHGLQKTVSAIAIALIIIVGGEGVYRARNLLTTAPIDEVWPAPSANEFPAPGNARERVLIAGRSTMNYGRLAALGLPSVNGYDPYNYTHIWRYLDLMTRGHVSDVGVRVWGDTRGIVRWDLADALGVGWIVTPEPIGDLPPWLELVSEIPDAPNFVFYKGMERARRYVYRNTNARPRAFWARRAISADPEHPAHHLAEQADLRSTAIVEGWGFSAVNFQGADDVVTVVESRTGVLALETISAQKSFLVMSEIWHPGWRLTVDGAPAELFRTDIALMGAWIDPGHHRMELRFHQPLRQAGIGLSLISAAAIFCNFLWRFRRHRWTECSHDRRYLPNT
ncbi:MAG: hypothetical protein IT350_10575 [Deltaproteobacteria bacterium]|nr:hypothetical protein [Deltaproteobacteria bacterium]